MNQLTLEWVEKEDGQSPQTMNAPTVPVLLKNFKRCGVLRHIFIPHTKRRIP